VFPPGVTELAEPPAALPWWWPAAVAALIAVGLAGAAGLRSARHAWTASELLGSAG
jgi:hypothetical protein